MARYQQGKRKDCREVHDVVGPRNERPRCHDDDSRNGQNAKEHAPLVHAHNFGQFDEEVGSGDFFRRRAPLWSALA